MPTTTIRIEDELKARVADAAAHAGKTTHAFILDAISQTVEQTELDRQFHAIAAKRWDKLLVSGRTVPWEETKAYLTARSKGQRPRRPATSKH